MEYLKCKVQWSSERTNDADNNNGCEYGIYTFDVEQSDYNPEIGLGGYDVINVEWYKSEIERDNIIKNQNK
tara:strand:+ start:224 stop:436 length:213 start_codon:yes stop_codon:yes gene_type:complete